MAFTMGFVASDAAQLWVPDRKKIKAIVARKYFMNPPYGYRQPPS
jgi:hypothetical protein